MKRLVLLSFVFSFQLQCFNCFTFRSFGYNHVTNQALLAKTSKQSESLDALNAEREKLLSVSASEELERTKARLQKMSFQKGSSSGPTSDSIDQENDPYFSERQELYQLFIRESANALKGKLQAFKLKTNGRKPDLANRMVQHTLEQRHPELLESHDEDDHDEQIKDNQKSDQSKKGEEDEGSIILTSFASISPLSLSAGTALGAAKIHKPTPIQSKAIPKIVGGENVILHAETGSGKTLAYLLPITEYLHSTVAKQKAESGEKKEPILLLMTPSRELASQVAGVAEVLAPEGCVRLVTEPTDLSDDLGRGEVEKGEVDVYGGRKERKSSKRGKQVGRIIVGSAKSIMVSLYGSNKLPAPPTPKPAAKAFLRSVRWVVLDEVDRLLSIPKTRQDRKKNSSKKHEKPAAILTAAIARLTLSRAQIVACSATVGRPLRRELSRVLGLPSQECPEVIRAESDGIATEQGDGGHIGRMVTIPPTVENYVLPCDGTSSGSLLTTASFAAKQLAPHNKKVLLVLSRGCGLNTRETLGAMKHLGAHPNPQSLAEALEGGSDGMSISGTDKLIQTHREVSGSVGVGQSLDNEEGYLLVTGEDSVRGLHLDKLDIVIVVGRPHGPDEYTHIAGRTGRAGRKGGKVVNVVSYEQAAALTSWEKMLNVDFIPIGMNEIENELL